MEEQWKFRAHIGYSKGKGVRMEVKQYKGIELFREIGSGKTIYYVQSDKKNYDSEEALIKSLKLPAPPQTTQQ